MIKINNNYSQFVLTRIYSELTGRKVKPVTSVIIFMISILPDVCNNTKNNAPTPINS